MKTIERPPAGFEALLEALRAVGLPVGAREVLRLHHVFGLEPSLGQAPPPDRQLRDLLATALVHDAAERRLFDQVYEPWASRWQEWAARGAPLTAEPSEDKQDVWRPMAAPPPTVGEVEPRPWIGRRRLATVAASALVTAIAILAILRWHLAEDPSVPEPVSQLAKAPSYDLPETEEGFRILSPGPAPTMFTEWIPTLEIISQGQSPASRAWPPLVLGAVALLATAGLAWRWARKSWIPEILPDPLPGPARLPLLPLDAGPELLDPGAANALVWGVGRHITERLTRELDLDHTAHETARAGGLPELRYVPEQRLREVWLWLDGTVDDPEMERWAEEIAASLSRAGLPVRIGGFDGTPQELLWDEGQLFRPQEAEAYRQTALVAVCSDGEALAQYFEDERASTARDVLRSLAAWPRLTFVDFSHDATLAAEVGPLGLPCVAPDDLPAFFGVGGAPEPIAREEVDPGELRAWRAALALGARPVDRATANAARRELGLGLSPWTFHKLRGDAWSGRAAQRESRPETGRSRNRTPTYAKSRATGSDETLPLNTAGGLEWTPAGRAALVAWLAESCQQERSGLRSGSLLERALDFWLKRLAKEAEGRERRGPLDPWQSRPAERHLRMEQALLRLWREPNEAAEELFELRSGNLGTDLQARLGELAPRDCTSHADVRIPLPWRRRDLSDRSLYLLAELGLGGVTRGDLRRPGRLGWALGLMASLGLCLIGWGIFEFRPTGLSDILIVNSGEQPPKDSYPFIERANLGNGRWDVIAGTARGRQRSVEVIPRAEIRLSWEPEEQPCIDGSGEAQIWRCGQSAKRPTTRDVAPWPRRSLALLAASTGDEDARALAAYLIDSGSADIVLLGLSPWDRIPEWLDDTVREDQLLAMIKPGIKGFVGLDHRGARASGELVAVDLGGMRRQLAREDGVIPLVKIWRFSREPAGNRESDLTAPSFSEGILLSNCP